MSPLVVGIDLSLTSSGVASSDGWVKRIQSKGRKDADLQDRAVRLGALALQVAETVFIDGCPDLVVIEAPAFSRVGGSNHDRSGLWWLVVSDLLASDIEVAEVPPSCRAKYASGAGNAGKDQVLAAVIRRYPDFDVSGNDIADSVALMAMGRRRLGHPIEDSLPLSHLSVMNRISWPPLPDATNNTTGETQ